MDNSVALVNSPLGVVAVLAFVAAFFFVLEQQTKAKLFQFLPPLLFIYATPVFLNNFNVIPSDSPVYAGLSAVVLPAFIVLMLIKVNVPAVVRVVADDERVGDDRDDVAVGDRREDLAGEGERPGVVDIVAGKDRRRRKRSKAQKKKKQGFQNENDENDSMSPGPSKKHKHA